MSSFKANESIIGIACLLTIFLQQQSYFIHSFQPIISNSSPSIKNHHCRRRCYNNRIKIIHPLQRQSKENDNDDEQSPDDRAGMGNAFQSLDDLSALDFGVVEDVVQPNKVSKTIKADEGLLKELSEGSVSRDDDDDNTSSLDEVKLYKEMYEEIETEGEDGVYDDILSDLNADSSNNNDKASTISETTVLTDADGIGTLNDDQEGTLTAVEISQDTEKFMKIALEEAIDDVKLKSTSDIEAALPDDILNDKEIMKEIDAIFEKANDKLLDSIADMKKEQAQFTEASAKSRSDALQLEEERLAQAEGSVSRLLIKVKEETQGVEQAMAELQMAQEELLDDPLMKAADLKSGGIVKQGALAGALLFSFRSLGELFLMMGPNGDEHGISAAVQGVIAIACAAYFALV